ncbi:MAG: potassium transporter TrkG, partial [Limibacillus sp.]
MAGAGSVFLLGGLAIYLPVRNEKRELQLRDGFMVVTGCWLVIVLFGALPYLLMETPQLSVIDAVFESMSGFTTTGATIITNLDGYLSPS